MGEKIGNVGISSLGNFGIWRETLVFGGELTCMASFVQENTYKMREI